MAITVTCAICGSRLSKLTAVKKTLTLSVKNTTIATMNTSTGSDPTSPAFSAS